MIVMHIKVVHSKNKSVDSSAQEITYATTSYNNRVVSNFSHIWL